MRRGVAVLIALAVMLSARAAVAQDNCQHVTVRDGSIYGCAYGSGSPTIVLAAGAGLGSRTWDRLVPDFAGIGRVITFDRPGFGRSAAVSGPRTPTRIAEELAQFLEGISASGPLLLVGHSMGGVHSLRFADLFPDSVMGVVLLDTPPPGFEEERLTLLTEQEREVRRQMLAAGPVDAPDVVGREREGANQEQWSFSSFPTTTPLAVVVADRQNFGTLGSPEAHRALWLRASERWLSLSSDSRIVVAEGSGHMVHHERQEIVVDVVGRMAAGRR